MIHFRVSTNVLLYKIFNILEKAREDLKNFIEDYTVTQVTLDDVFVNFAKMQEENQIFEQRNDHESIYRLIHKKRNSVGKFIRSNILLVINNFILI
jgi:hypothetical protein